MKKILLLGDSIRLSYRARVAELLTSHAQIVTPEDNCRFSTHTLLYLANWAPDDDYDIAQWNNGQWDTARLLDGEPLVPLEAYVQNQVRIAQILQRKARRLIFATTTPVHDDMVEKAPALQRSNECIEAYNAAAIAALAPLGVTFLDLNTPLRADLKRFIKDDRVHLTDDGVELCAGLVAENLMKQCGCA